MYEDVLKVADTYIDLLKINAENTADPLEKRRYIGFLSVTAVTFFEEAFKEIVRDFAQKKHPVLGNYVKIHFDKLNGRINLKDIKGDHIPKFGEKYKSRFIKLLDAAEKEKLREGAGSVQSSYGNIIAWRHGFVHGGAIPTNATYEEALKSYILGKEVLHCLDLAMRR